MSTVKDSERTNQSREQGQQPAERPKGGGGVSGRGPTELGKSETGETSGDSGSESRERSREMKE